MEKSVVKIYYDISGRGDHTSQNILGVGLMVTEDTIITCTHVIDAIFKLDPRLSTFTNKFGKELMSEIRDLNPTPRFWINFPLLNSTKEINKRLEVCIGSGTSSGELDITLLRILTDSTDLSVSPANFSIVERSGYNCKAYGIAQGITEGTYAKGKTGERQGAGWREITTDFTSGAYSIEQGFSGGGVYVDRLKAFIGIVMAKNIAPRVRIAYYLPISSIIEQWPELNLFINPAYPSRKEIDEAYTCDREHFNTNFIEIRQLGITNKVRHFIVTGRDIYSPLGVIRKIIYANNPLSSDLKYFYVNKPNEAVDSRIIIDSSTQEKQFLKDLMQACNATLRFDVGDANLETIRIKIIRSWSNRKIIFIPIVAELDSREDTPDKIFAIITPLLEAIDSQEINAKVEFYWAFSYKQNELQALLFNPVKQVEKYLKSSSSGFSSVNKSSKLYGPSGDDLKHWMRAFNINDKEEKEILNEKNVTTIEKRFVNIIKQYNSAIKEY